MKKFIAVCALVLSSFASFAQVSVDPSDSFYAMAQNWWFKGYVESLPQIRPYPANVIKEILSSVIEKGSERDAKLAQDEYERIFSKPWEVSMEIGMDVKLKQSIESDGTKENGKVRNITAAPLLAGDFTFPKWVSVGYHLGFFATKANESELIPEYQNSPHDSIYDASDVGPFSLYQDLNMNVSVGDTRFYVTAGLSRLGYGPFLNEGLSLNDTAYHSAGIVFNVSYGKFSYASTYATIGATDNVGDSVTKYLSDGKYLAFHALRYQFMPNAAASYYESSIFGPNSNISFLFPAPYMAIQEIGGANNNLQMGLLLEYWFIPTLEFATDIFVDDFPVNDFVKLNYDSKYRVGLQTGLVFTPENSPCTRMSLDYTIIMPYVYSHWEYTDESGHQISGTGYNYQNYTNNGICIGSTLPPNSDRAYFTAKFNPRKNLELNFFSSFARHQNVNEAISTKDAINYILAPSHTYSTDGGVFNHTIFSADEEDSTTGKHVKSAWNHLNFMSGKHSMITFQTGLSGSYALPRTKTGQFTINLGYTFEYISNAGVDRDIYEGQGLYTTSYDADGNKVWYYDGDSTAYTDYDDMVSAHRSELEDLVSAAYDAWEASLYARVNHYFSLSVKWAY